MLRSTLVLLAFLGVCFGVAASGALSPPGDWYRGLQKPSWNPPAWVFGPVWTALYITIAIAGWMAWRQGGLAAAWPAFAVYAFQLLCNGLWSWFFFGMHRPGLALADLILLWCGILATVILFYRIRPLAGLILLPYLAWVTFAGVLNWTLWRLN